MSIKWHPCILTVLFTRNCKCCHQIIIGLPFRKYLFHYSNVIFYSILFYSVIHMLFIFILIACTRKYKTRINFEKKSTLVKFLWFLLPCFFERKEICAKNPFLVFITEKICTWKNLSERRHNKSIKKHFYQSVNKK